MPERGIFCFKNMPIENEIKEGQVFRARIAKSSIGVEIDMQVHIVTDDGRVIVGRPKNRRLAVITTKDVLRSGGEIEIGGRIGKVII